MLSRLIADSRDGPHGTRPVRRADPHALDPRPSVVGTGEANRRRPAVIVSNDNANATAARLGRGVVTVVPVTSNTTRVFPFQVLLPAAETGIHVDSKAQAEQVRSVSVERLGRVIGRLSTT